ncbi:hypothetical protein BDV37DRAFT_267137 [Aspergillus pseudonomiae]|uniref:Uncharacterized protein n=1 Tax=Aspergillus pseudonomiae TaxID=1506151 RepID=A0A5N7CRZ3_9EURO|nr:uncharacterized protein BDV37DRAFT_267137 [Aspergillus pseudonomiae]KAE8396905.1 hypothetical protein BDV37DRAFT_267137 [Aspergillus pseudonomiae]
MLLCLCWDLFAKYQWLSHYRVADEINGYVDDLLYVVRFVACFFLIMGRIGSFAILLLQAHGQ